MCIICIKKSGVEIPSREALEIMWMNNPDGAGFMFSHKGVVHIEKGFMKFEDFMNKIDIVKREFKTKELPFVFHFRISTAGGIKPENCHPFPITGTLGMIRKTSCISDWGVAHNGVLDFVPRKGISDTMEYILSQLSIMHEMNHRFMFDGRFKRLVENATTCNRLCFLYGDGRIVTTGEWVDDGDYSYSNTSYKELKKFSNKGFYSTCYDDYDWYYDYKSKQDSVKSKFVSICDADIAGFDVCLNGKIQDVYGFAIDKDLNVYECNISSDSVSLVKGADLIPFREDAGYSVDVSYTAELVESKSSYIVRCEYCGNDMYLEDAYEASSMDDALICEECASQLCLPVVKHIV